MAVSKVAGPERAELEKWLKALQSEQERLRGEVRQRQLELATVEEQATLVERLLNVGQPLASSIRVDAEAAGSERQRGDSTLGLEDAVVGLLQAAGEPLHISRIREGLLRQGVPIPGRGDEANIILRLRKAEDRFTRVARGTYGLAEWKLPPLVSASRKGRRRAAR